MCIMETSSWFYGVIMQFSSWTNDAPGEPLEIWTLQYKKLAYYNTQLDKKECGDFV